MRPNVTAFFAKETGQMSYCFGERGVSIMGRLSGDALLRPVTRKNPVGRVQSDVSTQVEAEEQEGRQERAAEEPRCSPASRRGRGADAGAGDDAG